MKGKLAQARTVTYAANMQWPAVGIRLGCSRKTASDTLPTLLAKVTEHTSTQLHTNICTHVNTHTRWNKQKHAQHESYSAHEMGTVAENPLECPTAILFLRARAPFILSYYRQCAAATSTMIDTVRMKLLQRKQGCNLEYKFPWNVRYRTRYCSLDTPPSISG